MWRLRSGWASVAVTCLDCTRRRWRLCGGGSIERSGCLALEPLERAEAERRKAATQVRGKDEDGEPIIGEGKLPSPNNETEKGQSRDKIAEAVGFSRRTYEKAKAVMLAAAADPEKFGPVPKRPHAVP